MAKKRHESCRKCPLALATGYVHNVLNHLGTTAMRKFPGEIVSWEQVYRLCLKLADQVTDLPVPPDMIIAIGRGGYIPARLLSDLLGVFDLTSFKIEHYQYTHRVKAARVRYPLSAPVRGRHILLLDDVCDSGDTYTCALEHIHTQGPPASIVTAALHYKQSSAHYRPDLFAEVVAQWRWMLYPWAWVEDLGALYHQMQPRPDNTTEFQHQLQLRHGIVVELSLLQSLFTRIVALDIKQDSGHEYP